MAVVDHDGREVNVVPTATDISIAEELLNDPEALAVLWHEERLTSWLNAGATLDNAEAALASRDIPGYAAMIAAEYDSIFIRELLAEGWEQNPVLRSWVDTILREHAATLTVHFGTSFPHLGPEDKVPYMRGVKVDAVESYTANADGSHTLAVRQHDYDNADLNSAGEETTNFTQVRGEEVTPVLTFVALNGQVYLANIVLG